jgi:hypothetical protein
MNLKSPWRLLQFVNHLWWMLTEGLGWLWMVLDGCEWIRMVMAAVDLTRT